MKQLWQIKNEDGIREGEDKAEVDSQTAGRNFYPC